MVKSIQFKENSEWRKYLHVVLTNAMTLEIYNSSKSIVGFRFKLDSDGYVVQPTKSEMDVAKLVYRSCWNWLNGDEPESMDYEAVFNADELARERFDWTGAGYPESHEEGERETFLCSKIAEYEDI